MELYRKIYIKTEEDLPKEVGNYNVGLKTHEGIILHYPFYGDIGFEIDKNWWLKEVDFWLQPIEITDADIKASVPNYMDFALRGAWMAGAEAMRDGEIKHIEK